jgi:DNA-directed RNA polymerase subunit RPC12/RpoP
MKPLLYACGILALILGILIFGNAKSALHEIEAMVLMLIGAVLIVGGAVLGGIDRLMAAFLGPDIEGTCPSCNAAVIAHEQQTQIACPTCRRCLMVKEGRFERAEPSAP